MYDQPCNILKNYQSIKIKKFKFIIQKMKNFSIKKNKMRIRGFNDFNYFELLSGSDKENAHSKIIAELLNPKGMHYQDNLFLDLFFEIINKNNLKNEQWEITTEFFIEHDKYGNGRIDIALKSSKYFIVLENKIHAGEQEAQIYKYVESIKKEKKNINIIVVYLTLDKHPPSPYSLKEYRLEDNKLFQENEKISELITISYEDILKWMKIILIEVDNVSSLREIIKQYIKTLEKLLHKESNIMNLVDHLLKDENKDTLITLIENYDDFIAYANRDSECKIILENENLKETIIKIKRHIRQLVAKEIKQFIATDFSYIDGHENFGTYAKMSYILFENKNKFKFKYILFFYQQDTLKLKIGKIKDGSKDIHQIREECGKKYCYELIEKEKCFEISMIDNFDSIDFYKNYLKNTAQIEYLKETILEKLSGFEGSVKNSVSI